MGNIIGEKFDEFVINQINARQSLYGNGFNSNGLTQSDLLLLNSRNAWLKLASSVNVISQTKKEIDMPMGGTESIDVDTDTGAQRLRDIGINNTEDFLGNKLAQKTVLFNTLTTVTDNNKFATPRSGVTKTGELFNLNNSYGLGGTKFGINPSPGLVSAEITNLNRGSIRNATVTIKAFNQFQFELIELVYLRLGFTMMLEWGFDKYIDSNNGSLEKVGNTIIDDNFFSTKPLSQLSMLSLIQEKRKEYQGNYDGFFGKVVNFDWSFNKNGSYDINLKLVTLGDVIESIKTKSVAKPLTVTKIADLIKDIEPKNKEEAERIESLKNSAIADNANTSYIAQSLYVDVVNYTNWKDSNNNNYFSWNFVNKYFEDILEEDKFEILAGNALGLSTVPENPLKNNDQYSYYMTFQELLNRVAKYCIPSVGTEEEIGKQLRVTPIGSNNYCSAFPNQIAFDPKICLIRPIFTPSIVGEGNEENDKSFVKVWPWLSKLKQFGFLKENNTVLYGDIMSIYLNYDFISNCLSKNVDEEGNVSIYKFLSRICDGVNSSLGNFQQLEVVIRDDIFVTIQDQNTIPGIEKIEPNTLPSVAPFEIFGFNTSGSISSNFVTDFSFNTKITPQLAETISIGTTANNVSTKNYDGTAFSKWNSGLQDRFASFYADPAQLAKPTYDNDSSVLSDQQIQAEYDTFLRRSYNPNLRKQDQGLRTIQTFTRENGVTKTTTKKEDIKNYTAYGKKAPPSENQSGRAVNIKSPTTGRIYPYNRLLGGLTWPEYINEVISDALAEQARKEIKDFSTAELNTVYKDDYNWYLIRAFSGRLGPDKVYRQEKGEVYPIDSKYYLMERSFIEQGKDVFKSYIHTNVINKQFNEKDIPSNTIGFIPADLSLTFKGLSGIKIYQQLAVRQDFLPKQYPKALKFIIKGVNHSISNNDWNTNLTTLSIPNVQPTLDLDKTTDTDQNILSGGLLDTESFILTGPVEAPALTPVSVEIE